MEVEESVEGGGSIDYVNEGEVPKKSFIGFSDIEKYDNDELPQKCDSEDKKVLRDGFETIKLPKRMKNYIWPIIIIVNFCSAVKFISHILLFYDMFPIHL